MEKKLVLALVLSLVVIFFWATFFGPPAKPRSFNKPFRQVTSGPKEGERDLPASPTLDQPIEEETPYPRDQAEGEETHVVDTENFWAEFTNRGAILKELRLKNYYPRSGLSEEEKGFRSNWLLLISENQKDYSALRLVDPYEKTGVDLAAALWKAELLPGGRGIEFTYGSGNGLTFRKRMVFPPGELHAELTLEIENQNRDFIGGDWIFEFFPTAGISRNEYDVEQFYPHPVTATGYRKLGGGYEIETFLSSGSPQPLFKFPSPSAGIPIAFVGDYSKYFAALCQPLEGTVIAYSKAQVLFDEKEYLRRKKTSPALPDSQLREGLHRLNAVRCGISFHVPPPGSVETKRFLLYLGPKDPNILRDQENYPEYEPFVAVLKDDLGFFGAIARVLLLILKGFWHLTGSYGLAIILLTLLIRAVLFPISRKQQVSMANFQKKVAKFKPELDVLKKKYANQKQKLYEEQMKLYRKHGIGGPPLMGCLPMFLQLPVFFGLFTALRVAFELRQAPFLWIGDLSRPDGLIQFGTTYTLLFFKVSAFNILPIAMVVVWILQQKSMPKPADPQQAQMQKMMAWMPLLFGFMLYNYAAGLSLYFTISSLSGIFEQRVIKKRFLGESPTQNQAVKS